MLSYTHSSWGYKFRCSSDREVSNGSGWYYFSFLGWLPKFIPYGTIFARQYPSHLKSYRLFEPLFLAKHPFRGKSADLGRAGEAPRHGDRASPPPPGGMTAFRLRGDKTEISCANGLELRDNNFNLGGLAIWDGIGRMDGNDQYEAEATAAVSGPAYFAIQTLLSECTIMYTTRPAGIPVRLNDTQNPKPLVPLRAA
jgi:hypothetical protein